MGNHGEGRCVAVWEFLLKAFSEVWEVVKTVIPMIAPIYFAHRLQKSQTERKKPGSKVGDPSRTSRMNED